MMVPEIYCQINWMNILYYSIHNLHYKIKIDPIFENVSNLQGVYDKFPDFFRMVLFKTVVDSWKFSMLLLYILWDDWPIFMISDSNQQLQQELEYTLLKSDYHSWWISKMQSDTLEEW